MAPTLLGKAFLKCKNATNTVGLKLSNIYYRNIIGHVSGDVEIHWGAEFRNPAQIRIGEKTLIKRGVILNGRTSQRPFGIDLGAGAYIKENCYLDAYGGYIQTGVHLALGQFCILGGHGGLTIGDYVIIGPYSYVIPSNHIFRDLELPYMLQGNCDQGVVIEDNVWIGGGVIILAGVTIGRNSVIGAGAVVPKDIPPNSLYVSQSPRILRRLHDDSNHECHD